MGRASHLKPWEVVRITVALPGAGYLKKGTVTITGREADEQVFMVQGVAC